MALTRRQRNELFEALDKNGVDPSDCELRTIQDKSGTTWTEIEHVPTQSAFTLSEEPTPYVFRWVVVDGPDSGAENATGAWSRALEEFTHWAEEVQYVADVPDFWVELRQVPEILKAAHRHGASNAPFTADEQAQISARIDQVKDIVRDQVWLTDEYLVLKEAEEAGVSTSLRLAEDVGQRELTAGQISAIEHALDEVKEATTRVGRKDWVMMANGALLSVIVTDLVPAHVVQTLFNVLITGIGHIFGIGGPPPTHGRPFLSCDGGRAVVVRSYGSPASAGGTGLGSYVPQWGRRGGIRVVARIVSNVTDLSAVTSGLGRSRDRHLHRGQALSNSGVPDPFAPELLRHWRFTGNDHADIDVTRRETPVHASGFTTRAGLKGGRARRTRCWR